MSRAARSGASSGVWSRPDRDPRFHGVTVVVECEVDEPVKPPDNPVEITEVRLFPPWSSPRSSPWACRTCSGPPWTARPSSSSPRRGPCFCGVRAPADADGAPADFDLAFRVARYRGRVRPSLLLASPLLLTACGARLAASPGDPAASYAYVIAPPAAGSWKLDVEARFEGAPSERLVMPEGPEAVGDVVLVDGAGVHPIPRAGDAWVAPACRSRCTVRYALDLGTLASLCHHMDCLRRVGDAVLGPANAWMLHPEPMGEAAMHVDVRGGDPRRFVTGLRRGPSGGYAFRARDLGEASYTAFGDFRRVRADVAGAELEVALLGAPLAMGDAAAVGAVKDAAGCVAGAFGRFPVGATVFVVPVQGRQEVVFGRVLSLAGASVALLFGTETPAAQMHDEWVPVHELFHLGTPSFVGEAHWLEEGLATYYEPVLRERAGWMREADLWQHFAREMPRGLRKRRRAARARAARRHRLDLLGRGTLRAARGRPHPRGDRRPEIAR